MEFEVDKSKFKTAKGAYITQGLFHEFSQNKHLTYYTLQGHDVKYKGKVFPSLKRAFLDMEDPTEYLFAEKYLFDWDHWQRICNNAMIKRHVDEWRKELSLRLKAKGIANLKQMASSGDRAASQWLAESKWDVALRGRPKKLSTDEVENMRDTSDTAHVLRLVQETKNG